MTNQYSFSGQLLRSHLKHKLGGSSPQEYKVVSKHAYDDLGRLLEIKKVLVANGTSQGEKTTAQLEYDALGQVKKKTLAPSHSGGAGLETLDYAYNIRGWLLGVNKGEVLGANGITAGGRWFGFELGYDKLTNTAGQNFKAAQFNGNITGMLWKSKSDGIRRKYDFSYDGANRLMQGLFEQHNEGGSWDRGTVDYTVKMGDGLTPTLAYDANGNILRMQQWGLKLAGSTQIDDLQYSYFDYSNKLRSVAEQGTGTTEHKLGDFTDKNTGGAQDWIL